MCTTVTINSVLLVLFFRLCHERYMLVLQRLKYEGYIQISFYGDEWNGTKYKESGI